MRLGYPVLDAVGGLLIAFFIARTGWEIGRNTSRVLSDRVVLAEEDIRRVVMTEPAVMGCHQIRSRGSADHTFLDLHVWFRPDMPLHEAHRLSHVVKDKLMASSRRLRTPSSTSNRRRPTADRPPRSALANARRLSSQPFQLTGQWRSTVSGSARERTRTRNRDPSGITSYSLM